MSLVRTPYEAGFNRMTSDIPSDHEGHPADLLAEAEAHYEDALEADPAIDFIGIDNYMPLADWRDGFEHADADWGAIYNLDYLKSNIAGGEGYDWYYRGPEAEALQDRTPITDGAYGEPWVFRYKDLLNWWSNAHHDRPGGVRSETATAWEPRSKPIWFTELGCAAVDKGRMSPTSSSTPSRRNRLCRSIRRGRGTT